MLKIFRKTTLASPLYLFGNMMTNKKSCTIASLPDSPCTDFHNVEGVTIENLLRRPETRNYFLEDRSACRHSHSLTKSSPFWGECSDGVGHTLYYKFFRSVFTPGPRFLSSCRRYSWSIRQSGFCCGKHNRLAIILILSLSNCLCKPLHSSLQWRMALHDYMSRFNRPNIFHWQIFP
jgi:hypothetical protein